MTAATPVLTEFVTKQDCQNSFEVRRNCFLWKNAFLGLTCFPQLTQLTKESQKIAQLPN